MTTAEASAALSAGDMDRAFANFIVYGHADRQMDLSLTKPYAQNRLADRLMAMKDERGELQAAAGAAIRLASIEVSRHGHEDAGRGWSERARDLLEQVGPCVEWGYWELALLSCDRTDVTHLLAATERALALSRTFGDPALEAMARADRGLALVTQGRVEEGFADLEAAMTAVLSGEVPLAFNFNGTIHYRGDDGRLQMALVPWSCTVEYRFDAGVWRQAMDDYYPNARWIALHQNTLDALNAYVW